MRRILSCNISSLMLHGKLCYESCKTSSSSSSVDHLRMRELSASLISVYENEKKKKQLDMDLKSHRNRDIFSSKALILASVFLSFDYLDLVSSWYQIHFFK